MIYTIVGSSSLQRQLTQKSTEGEGPIPILDTCLPGCFDLNGRTYHYKKCVNERRRKSYIKNIDKHRSYSKSHKSRYAQGRCSADKRQLCWGLTLDQWISLVVDKNCHYCDGPLSETGAGLDRKDSSRGYMYDNVVPCCKKCNSIKCDQLTYEEMIAVMKLLKEMRSSPKP